MKSLREIAVLCYYFPPLNSVGGRRWSKFSKFFGRENIGITFFTADPQQYPDSLKNSSWVDELDRKHRVIRLKTGYPIVVNAGSKNFFQKILYRLQIQRIKRNTTGNIYDPSTFWNSKMNEIISYLQENEIFHVIVSGAPFAYMYHALEIKKHIPGVKLIADFRDLWVDSKLGYGDYVKQFQSAERYEVEKKRQLEVIRNFDHIVVVSQDIKTGFVQKHSVPDSKVTIIPNGFDPEEYMAALPVDLPYSGKVRFLYFGTVNCSKSYYSKFLGALERLAVSDQELFSVTEFTFVGNTNIAFSEALDKLNLPNISQKSPMNLKEAVALSGSYDFVLYFKMENDLVNSFGTKFFDYLRFRKPIIILSPQGAVTNYIREKNIGVVLNEKDVYCSLKEVISKPTLIKGRFNVNEEFHEFDLHQLSRKYIELLTSL